VMGYVSLRHRPQGDSLWWIFPVGRTLPGPVACFRNPNHFAAFLAMLCPPTLALLAHDVAKIRLVRALLGLAALGCLAGGIVVSLSRGALLACAVGFMVCTVLFFVQRRFVTGGIMIGLGIAGIVGLLLVPNPEIRERLATLKDIRSTDSYQTRVAAWADSFAIWRAYPIAGAGANGYRMVYPQHRTTTQGAHMMSHAENEYIQWATDGGLLGLAVLAALVYGLARTAVIPPLRARAPSPIVVASCGALATAAAHSAVDYPLHIPLYSIPLASIVGLALPRSIAAAFGGSIRQRLRDALPAGIGVAVSFLLIFTWGRKTHSDATFRLRGASLLQLCDALMWAPTSQYAWFEMGKDIGRKRTPEARLLATRCLDRAGKMDPNNYKLWYKIGERKDKLRDREGAARAFKRASDLRDWLQVPYLPEDLE